MSNIRAIAHLWQVMNEAAAKWDKPEAVTAHMNCSFHEFVTICQDFTLKEIEHACLCIIKDEWDQSNVVMCTENGFSGHYWRNKAVASEA